MGYTCHLLSLLVRYLLPLSPLSPPVDSAEALFSMLQRFGLCKGDKWPNQVREHRENEPS
jgi:hypothetical protein